MSRLFNGTSEYLYSSRGSRWANRTNPYTIGAWVYPTADRNAAADQRAGIVCCEIVAGNNAMPFALTYGRFDSGWANIGNAFAASYYNGSSWAAYARDPTAVVLNRWYHVCVVFATTPTRTLTLYRNGVQVAQSTPVAPTANTVDISLYIGRAWDVAAAYRYFPGRIADAFMVDGALTAGEVAAIAAGWPVRLIRAAAYAANSQFHVPLHGLSNPEPDLGTNQVGFTIAGTAPRADGPPMAPQWGGAAAA